MKKELIALVIQGLSIKISKPHILKRENEVLANKSAEHWLNAVGGKVEKRSEASVKRGGKRSGKDKEQMHRICALKRANVNGVRTQLENSMSQKKRRKPLKNKKEHAENKIHNRLYEKIKYEQEEKNGEKGKISADTWVQIHLQELKTVEMKQDQQERTPASKNTTSIKSAIGTIENLSNTNGALQKDISFLQKGNTKLLGINVKLEDKLFSYEGLLDKIEAELMISRQKKQHAASLTEQMEELTADIQSQKKRFERERKLKQVYARKIDEIIHLLDQKCSDDELVHELHDLSRRTSEKESPIPPEVQNANIACTPMKMQRKEKKPSLMEFMSHGEASRHFVKSISFYDDDSESESSYTCDLEDDSFSSYCDKIASLNPIVKRDPLQFYAKCA